MSEVTRILSAIEQGDPSAAEELLPLMPSPSSQPTIPTPLLQSFFFLPDNRVAKDALSDEQPKRVCHER
jgi:hypothetical protein